MLVADVPLLEAEPYAASARAAGIAPVLIAAANTPPERLAKIAALGEGYTYCVARSGVTGAGDEVRFDHAEMLDALRRAGAPPPIFGFGISRPDHVRAALAAGAAGVISGSAIVDLVARGDARARLRRGDEGGDLLGSIWRSGRISDASPGRLPMISPYRQGRSGNAGNHGGGHSSFRYPEYHQAEQGQAHDDDRPGDDPGYQRIFSSRLRMLHKIVPIEFLSHAVLACRP